MITQLPEVATEEDSGVQYREVLHAFLDMRCLDIATGVVSGDPFEQVTIPVALLDDCQHSTTICSTCQESWRLDYDFEDYIS